MHATAIELSRTDIDAWRDHRQHFVRNWHVAPRAGAGGPAGWAVKAVPPDIAGSGALRLDDVLTGIDGIPARDAQLFIDALAALVERGDGRISIERGGERVERPVMIR